MAIQPAGPLDERLQTARPAFSAWLLQPAVESVVLSGFRIVSRIFISWTELDDLGGGFWRLARDSSSDSRRVDEKTRLGLGLCERIDVGKVVVVPGRFVSGSKVVTTPSRTPQGRVASPVAFALACSVGDVWCMVVSGVSNC